MKYEIRVDVSKGSVDVTLYENGCPVEGHSDTTNTIKAADLLRPVVERVAVRVEAKRL